MSVTEPGAREGGIAPKPRVLVVDDDPGNRYLRGNVLDDFEVEVAVDGAEMMERIAHAVPSILLLDVMLPGRDGFQLAAELAGDDRYRNIPVIFLTARTDPADVVTGLELGGYDYIKKPFDEAELVARIRSALKRSTERQRLAHDVIIDPHTGLYNRRYLSDFIKNESGKIKRSLSDFAIAMVDIDHFKRLNDTYGHQCGDYVLKEFAHVMRTCVRTYDLAIRYGGEEFLVVLPAASRNDALQVLERLRAANAAHEYRYGSIAVSFTFTCGIADLADIDPARSAFDDLIRVADERLYRGKRNGRDRIVAVD